MPRPPQPPNDVPDDVPDGVPDGVPATGLAVTVLGSGGPFVNATRASSGYLVWLDGRARVLVDAGGGVFERFGRTGAHLTDVDAVLLTHLHIDHSGGLAPLVFAGAMAGRTRPLTVVGPAPDQDEDRDQPGCAEFCDHLFGPRGAWRYLHSFEGFAVHPVEVPSTPGGPPRREVLALDGLSVDAVAVPHGMMPALAFRVRTPGASLTVSGDLSTHHPPLVDLARGTDLLVHDMALPERPTEHGHLHAKPSQVGRHAAEADVGHLLLSHVMPELEDERDDAERLVRAAYPGPVSWARDLDTLRVGPDGG